MLLIVQIWDAQNQEVTRFVGATSRRIASKIAEVLQTERPQRLCRTQARRRHSRREDKHRFKLDTKRMGTPSGGRCPLCAKSGRQLGLEDKTSTTLYAIIGRRIPFSSNSPTDSTVTAFSTAS